MLTDGEIVKMRTELERSLPGTAVIKAPTWTSDGGGGGTTTYAAAGTVACRISPMRAPENAEPETGDRITPDADWLVTLPASASVTTESRVTIASTDYTVTALRAPRSFEVSQQIEVSKVNA